MSRDLVFRLFSSTGTALRGRVPLLGIKIHIAVLRFTVLVRPARTMSRDLVFRLFSSMRTAFRGRVPLLRIRYTLRHCTLHIGETSQDHV